jgi:hypothetical protein
VQERLDHANIATTLDTVVAGSRAATTGVDLAALRLMG